MLHPLLEARLQAAAINAGVSGPQPRRGEAIFDDADPRTWTEFVGQARARQHLQAAIRSAQARGKRLDHVLIASISGAGKTSLARLIAHELGVGVLELSGVIGVDEARQALSAMKDGDVLFIDEIHMMVSGGKSKAEWLLPFLQTGKLLTSRGSEPMPDVTVIGATTDVQKLPHTITDRFIIQPMLAPYRDSEAVQILTGMAARMGFGTDDLPAVPETDLAALAEAANNSPRGMRNLLATYRDTLFQAGGAYDLDMALSWRGVTRDGLDQVAQDYLLVLVACEGQAALATIQGQMGESGPLQYTESLLGARGYMTIEGRGRKLTPEGVARAAKLIQARKREAAA
jgi:Holliday junction DNA helicase RuvB